ncbi:MAG: rhodanese-like domain-containing protein [Bacteroidia bacterium]|nr:rhodanese-like domain-containing protein [Bacteroidia bacterium]MDW8346117.1 rhodanese-like domain-containing protein [Bacteroidia bacterium]
MQTGDITVQELKKRLDAGENIILIDVREPHEYQICNLGGKLIPLGSLPQRLDELEEYKDKEIIVHCRTGGRSANAVAFLKSQGFTNPRNLIGGVHAWADQIDNAMPKY